MRGHGHDRAGAVAHHHVVGDPDGELLAVDRIDREGPGEDAGFVLVEVAAVHVGLGGTGFLIGFDGGLLIGGGDFRDQRMLGGNDHVGRTEEGVGSGGKDGDLGLAVGNRRHVEDDVRALAAADPVFLEQLDAFRPVEGVEFVDQALRVFRDPQHPLAQRAALDGVAFGFPFFDFLVGEHRAEVGRPPDGRVGDEGEADLVDLIAVPALGLEFANRLGFVCFLAEIRVIDLQENPLRPAHVFGIGGGDFPVPVVGETERFQLAAEGFDIGGGGDRRVLAGFDGVLFGG